MMVICFNCSAKTKESLDKLLEGGQYKNYTEVITTAIENLLVLHQIIMEENVIIIDDKNQIPQRKVKGRYFIKSKPSKTDLSYIKKRITLKNKPQATVPEIFTSIDSEIKNYNPATFPDDIWAKGQEVPLDRWIFGQHNKLLPAKASCRAIARLTAGKEEIVPINEIVEIIADSILQLGNYLYNHDEKNDLKRGEAFSTAFPTFRSEPEKGILRFTKQFIANVNKQGKVSGLLIDYKFINFSHGKKPALKLTEAGWKYAVLKNPVIDEEIFKLNEKFSDQEKKFLLRHISENLPSEDFAFRTIISKIKEGKDSPDKLDKELIKYLTPEKKNLLSSSYLSSQRSGAISRMVDLNLIRRHKDGIRINYSITNLAEKFIGNNL